MHISQITPDELWSKAKEELGKNLSSASFDVWIKDIKPKCFKDDQRTLVVIAQSDWAVRVIKDNYLPMILTYCNNVFPYLEKVEVLTLEEDAISATSLSSQNSETTSKIDEDSIYKLAETEQVFNPLYTFDTLVIGNSNKLAIAAATAVAKNPGEKYNPLFIYGGVGLGKTHMMHAIGNYFRNNLPNKKIVYTTCEKFTNELIEAIRTSKDANHNKLFREKYRTVDVLMIDDIQFLQNKPSTQEELFHTFNELHGSNKHIILTSDRTPKEISNLEDRLRTRFEWGLIVDIQAPSFETKVAILQKKAAQDRIMVDTDVLFMIAGKVESNIREMQSLLSRVALYASLTGSKVTVEIAEDALRDYIDHRKEQLSADSIINGVCKYFSVSRGDIVGKKKSKDIVEPRQIAIFLINEFLSLPLTTIGNIFGGRDHTTIMHARDKISECLKSNQRIILQVGDLRNIIKTNG